MTNPTQRFAVRPIIRILTLAVIACVSFGGWVALGGVVPTRSQRATDEHARTAGIVMVRYPPEISANDAAWTVAGTLGPTTIEALVVEGTTYHGHVVLRITVTASDSFGDPTVTRCYSYTLSHQMGDDTPARIACPHTSELVLTPPVPDPVLDSPAAVAKLTNLLRRLTAAQRHDPTAVQTLLAETFPAPTVVYAELDRHGVLAVGARTYETCMSGTVNDAGQVMVRPAHGINCRGG